MAADEEAPPVTLRPKLDRTWKRLPRVGVRAKDYTGELTEWFIAPTMDNDDAAATPANPRFVYVGGEYYQELRMVADDLMQLLYGRGLNRGSKASTLRVLRDDLRRRLARLAAD